MSVNKLIDKWKMQKGFNLISIPSVTLTEQEADTFLDMVFDESSMIKYARIERMIKPQKNIRALGFGSGRFLYPAGEFNESKYKKEWTHNKIQLATKEARGCVAIFDDDLEDLRGIETEAEWKIKLMGMIGKKIANELEEVGWISNTGAAPNAFAADDLRHMFDGWRYQTYYSQLVTDTYWNAAVPGGARVITACDGGTSGSVFDLAGKIAEQDTAAPYAWEFKYHRALKLLPSKYKMHGGLKNMNFLNSDIVTMDYLEALSQRATAIGDGIFTGAVDPSYLKVPIVDCPLMPTNLGTAAPYATIGAGDYTDVLLTPKGNMIVGIQREITIETERSAADQCTYVFYSVRLDFTIENTNAVVMIQCLTHAC